VDAVARLGQGKALVRSPVLQVVGFVDDECVQYVMISAMSSDPKTR
jgi:hypothetical protein